MRFAVAKQQGLDEATVADIDTGWDASSHLSPRHKAALAFADGFLANEPGSAARLEGFTDAERDELRMGLGLFHGFSKVLIALGVEPEPGTMATTEIPTPDTASVTASLDTGFAAAEAAVESALAGHLALLTAVRSRIDALLGGPPAHAPADDAWQPWIDVAELFVIDIHAIDDALFGEAAALIGPPATAALFVGMALADARARMRTSLV